MSTVTIVDVFIVAPAACRWNCVPQIFWWRGKTHQKLLVLSLLRAKLVVGCCYTYTMSWWRRGSSTWQIIQTDFEIVYPVLIYTWKYPNLQETMTTIMKDNSYTNLYSTLKDRCCGAFWCKTSTSDTLRGFGAHRDFTQAHHVQRDFEWPLLLKINVWGFGAGDFKQWLG